MSMCVCLFSGSEAWDTETVPSHMTTNPFIAHSYARMTLAFLEYYREYLESDLFIFCQSYICVSPFSFLLFTYSDLKTSHPDTLDQSAPVYTPPFPLYKHKHTKQHPIHILFLPFFSSLRISLSVFHTYTQAREVNCMHALLRQIRC
jgi:hypothetical protein